MRRAEGGPAEQLQVQQRIGQPRLAPHEQHAQRDAEGQHRQRVDRCALFGQLLQPVDRRQHRADRQQHAGRIDAPGVRVLVLGQQPAGRARAAAASPAPPPGRPRASRTTAAPRRRPAGRSRRPARSWRSTRRWRTGAAGRRGTCCGSAKASTAPASRRQCPAARASRSAWPTLRAKAATTDAAAKAAAPISSSLRRPMRSPSVPMVIRKPATRKP